MESFLPSNYRDVKHGEYTFTECKESYVQVHIKCWILGRHTSDNKAGYGVSYSKADHPLYVDTSFICMPICSNSFRVFRNMGGRVIGEPTENHAKRFIQKSLHLHGLVE